MRREHQFRAVGDAGRDEEHGTWSVTFTDAQGAERRIDWAWPTPPKPASCSASTRSSLSKDGDQLQAPFLISYAAATARHGTRPRSGRLDEADEVRRRKASTRSSPPHPAPPPKPSPPSAAPAPPGPRRKEDPARGLRLRHRAGPQGVRRFSATRASAK